MCLGEEDTIQSNTTKLDRPPARPPAASTTQRKGSEAGVGQPPASDGAVALPPSLPPSLDSLQTWPPPQNSLPGPFKSGPYFYLLLPRLLARSLSIPLPPRRNPQAGRRADSSPSLPPSLPSLPGARRQAGTSCRPRGSAVNQPWQPARNSIPLPASPATHSQSQSQEEIHRAGQGRTNKYQNTSSSSSNSLAESD